MSRNLARPYFPTPPATYSPTYMAELVRSFSTYLEQQGNPGLGRFTSATMTHMPTSSSGLEDGALWNDAGTVRLWSTGWTAPAYTTITGTDISNWNTAYGWGDHGAAGYLESANNLSDVANVATSRTNLGLGTGDSPSFAGLTVDTTTLHVDSTNNRVGIGTASPTNDLHISDTAGSASISLTANNAQTSYILFGDTDADNVGRILYSHSSDYMAFNVNAAEAARISSSGSLGVGITTPSVPLDVNGAVRTRATTVAGLPAAGTAGRGARHFVTDATAATFASVVAGGGANEVPVYSDGTNWRIG